MKRRSWRGVVVASLPILWLLSMPPVSHAAALEAWERELPGSSHRVHHPNSHAAHLTLHLWHASWAGQEEDQDRENRRLQLLRVGPSPYPMQRQFMGTPPWFPPLVPPFYPHRAPAFQPRYEHPRFSEPWEDFPDNEWMEEE